MSTEVVMPQMGESITEGTLTRWLKKIGEKVERDEMIFEISTDKVDAEIPSPAAGVLLEVKVNEGETVEVGTVVALVGDEAQASAGSSSNGASAQASAQASGAQIAAASANGNVTAQQDASSGKDKVVAQGDGAEAASAKAMDAEGGQLTAGASIEDVQSPEDAAAREAAQIASSTGANAAAETLTAQNNALTQSGSASSQTSSSSQASNTTSSSQNTAAQNASIAEQGGGYSQPASATTQTTQPTAQTSATEDASANDLRRTRSSPLVRKIAEEHNVDIRQLEGTGASGRVTKNDIMSFIESGDAQASAPAMQAQAPTQAQHPQAQLPVQGQQPQMPQPPQAQMPPAMPAPVTPSQMPAQPSVQMQQFAPPSTAMQTPAYNATAMQTPMNGDRVEPMSVMRKKIAEHMIMSQTVSAHVATVYEVDMTRINKLREANKNSFQERNGTKLTYMPFIFQAVTNAIRQFPIFNAQVAGDQIIYKRDINLGMAVALDWGLIVPVIKRADDLSLAGIARAANDLADRARAKQLKPDEVAGGTFTITNPGVFGGLIGTPLINQPQVAILAIGAIEKRPRVMTTPEGEDFLAIRTMSYFTLSYDHRIIDGSDAEKFLGHVKRVLEEANFTV